MTHLHQSLRSAADLAVADGNTLANIVVARWAETYRASIEEVRAAFDAALSKQSLTPNNYEEMDK